MDVLSPTQRSYNMSRIKPVNTRPELIVRQLLWRRGFRYRLHRKDLPGKPDIAFMTQKKALFVHGCFWHKHTCPYFKWPKTNSEFWVKKIEGNVSRDSINCHLLAESGWKVLIIWECETRYKNTKKLLEKIEEFLAS